MASDTHIWEIFCIFARVMNIASGLYRSVEVLCREFGLEKLNVLPRYCRLYAAETQRITPPHTDFAH